MENRRPPALFAFLFSVQEGIAETGLVCRSLHTRFYARHIIFHGRMISAQLFPPSNSTRIQQKLLLIKFASALELTVDVRWARFNEAQIFLTSKKRPETPV
jgi:hypothetical protein